MEQTLDDDESSMELDSDNDTPPTPQFTSTPNNNARPATNRSNRRNQTSFTLPSTSSSSSRSRNGSKARTGLFQSPTLPDPQPSTSSGSSRSRNTSGRSNNLTALPSYQRDLGALVPIGIDVGIPKMDNFNGRSCHFIASLRASMYVMKMNHVNVPRPHPSQDLFTRLFVEIFWNYGSSALTVNPEAILDAFVERFMARDVQLHVDIPTMYQHPKDRYSLVHKYYINYSCLYMICPFRYYDSRLFFERLAGYYRRGITTVLRRPRTETVVEPCQLFEIFQPILQTNKRYGECCNRTYDISTLDRVGVITIIVDEPRQNQSVQR